MTHFFPAFMWLFLFLRQPVSKDYVTNLSRKHVSFLINFTVVYRLPSTVYRLSSIVYRLSSIVNGLGFSIVVKNSFRENLSTLCRPTVGWRLAVCVWNRITSSVRSLTRLFAQSPIFPWDRRCRSLSSRGRHLGLLMRAKLERVQNARVVEDTAGGKIGT